MLFRYEKEWSIDAWYNVDESWKHHDINNWKKPEEESYTLYESTYMKYPELANPQRMKAD